MIYIGKVFEKFRGGWVTPKGELINSDFAQHDLSARKIIKQRYSSSYDNMCGYEHIDETCRREFLIIKGWVLLTGNPYPSMGITRYIFIVCRSEEKITPQQHELIKKLMNNGVKFSGYVTV